MNLGKEHDNSPPCSILGRIPVQLYMYDLQGSGWVSIQNPLPRICRMTYRRSLKRPTIFGIQSKMVMLSIPRVYFGNQSKHCWWKKSCTTWDVKNPVNNGINYLSTGINYLSTGAGFLPSTVWATFSGCSSTHAYSTVEKTSIFTLHHIQEFCW